MVYASYTRSTRQIPRAHLASLVPPGSIRSGRVDPRYVQRLSEEQHLHLARGEDSEHRGAAKAAPACSRARHPINQHTGTMPIPTSASCGNSSILRKVSGESVACTKSIGIQTAAARLNPDKKRQPGPNFVTRNDDQNPTSLS